MLTPALKFTLILIGSWILAVLAGRFTHKIELKIIAILLCIFIAFGVIGAMIFHDLPAVFMQLQGA